MKLKGSYENGTGRKEYKVVFIHAAKSIFDKGSRDEIHFSLLETNQIRFVQGNHLLDILTTNSTVQATHPKQETVILGGIVHWKPERTTSTDQTGMNLHNQTYTTSSGIRSHAILQKHLDPKSTKEEATPHKQNDQIT
jgi:hypothetical protein